MRTTILAVVPAAAVLALPTTPPPAQAETAPRVWQVGPTRTLTTPSEAAAVARDVRDQLLDADAARDDYGVILDPDTLAVDEQATAAARADRRDSA